MLYDKFEKLLKPKRNNFLKIIEVIFDEANLQNDNKSKIIPIKIPESEFSDNAEEIIEMINEGEKHNIIQIASEREFFRNSGADIEPGEKTWKQKHMSNKVWDESLDMFVECGDKKESNFLYFLVNDVNRLKEIKENLN